MSSSASSFSLAELIDIPHLQLALEQLSEAVGFSFRILDPDGNVLIDTDPNPICRVFHKTSAELCLKCETCRQELNHQVIEGQHYYYSCVNHLGHLASPITVDGMNLGTLVIQHFLTSPPDLDSCEVIARQYGFDTEQYGKYIRQLPILDFEQLRHYMEFAEEFVHLAAGQGMREKRLAQLHDTLHESEFALRERDICLDVILNIVQIGVWSWHVPSGRIHVERTSRGSIDSNSRATTDELRDFLVHVHPDDLVRLEQAIEDYLEGRTPLYQCEYRFSRRGDYRWLFSQGKAIEWDMQNNPVRIVGTTQDVTERKRYELEIASSESRFRSIIEQSPIGIQLFDSKGLLIHANQASMRIFGVRQVDDILGFDLFSDPNIPEHRKQQLKSRRPVDIGIDFDFSKVTSQALYDTTKTGIRYLEMDIIPLCAQGPDQQENLTGYLLQVQDVTERNKLEHTLRDREKRHRVVLDSSQVGILIARHETILYTNLLIRRLIGDGVNVSEIKTFLDQIHPDDVNLARKLLDMSNQAPPAFPGDHMLRLLGPDGQYLFFQVRVSVIQWDEEHAVLASMLDVTAAHKARLKVVEKERRFRELFDNITDPVYILEITEKQRIGLILECNRAAQESLGYERHEMVGRAFKTILPPSLASGSGGRVKRLLEHGRHTFESQFRRKDGTTLPIEANIHLIEWEGKKAILSVSRDISERIKIQTQALRAQKMEAVGRLAGGIAHDLNNILQGVLGYVELVEEVPGIPDDARTSLSNAMEAIGRGQSFIRQLMAFGRKGKYHPEVLDLTKTISQLVTLIRRVIGGHITLDYQPVEDVRLVEADPGQIEQILLNLCLNARDAMPDGGTITIKLENVTPEPSWYAHHPDRLVGEYVLISVGDTGEGIPADVKDKIFEPFFTTKPSGKGTGLGLATVYAIVEQHKGGIKVESEPGKGSLFQISLPASSKAQCDTQIHLEKEESPVTLDMQGKTILLAEDNPMVRNLSVRVLTRSGFKVLVAQDGEQALEVFRNHRDDITCLILDVIMPFRNGRDVYEAISQEKPGIPVLFCSGYSDDLLQEEYMLDIPGDLLQKPYSGKTLVQTLRRVLSHSNPV